MPGTWEFGRDERLDIPHAGDRLGGQATQPLPPGPIPLGFAVGDKERNTAQLLLGCIVLPGELLDEVVQGGTPIVDAIAQWDVQLVDRGVERRA